MMLPPFTFAHPTRPALRLLFLTLLLAVTAGISRAAFITSVVETGGDNEATDTITAKYTGQTWNTTVNNEPLLATPAGTPFTVPAFGHYVPTFVDRAHRYANNLTPPFNIPAYLSGQEYIMSGNDNRENPNYRLDVTVSQPVRVYMLIDNRLGASSNADPPTFGPTTMQWILDEAWTATSNGINRTSNPAVPDEVPIDEGSNGTIEQWYSVYYKDYPAGTFQLKQADNDTRNMYGVVIGPQPGVVNPITAFTTATTSIPEGGSATLSWQIDPAATSAVIDNGVGNILPLTNASGIGSVSVSPADDTTYTLTVNTPGNSQQSSVSVGIQLIESFTGSPGAALPGDTVTLQWNVRSGTSVSIAGIGDVTPLTNAQGLGSTTAPHTRNPYVLTATRNVATATARAYIGVLPPSQRYALIDIGALGGNPEAGAAGALEVGAGAHNTNATNLAATPLTSDSGDPFTIAIDNLAPNGTAVGGLDWRDRGDGNGTPLTFLAEDFVKNNAGVIHVTLGSLPAGTYDVISYHLDPTLSQTEEIKFFITDADSAGTPRDTGFPGTASWPGHPADTGAPGFANLNAEHVAQKGFLYSLRADGTNDVHIYFDSRASSIDDECPFNGLVLIPRPDPNTSFNIVSVQHTSGVVTDTVTLEFESVPGQTYRLVTSGNLQTWTTVNPAIAAHPTNSTTTVSDPAVPKTDPRRYYKVERTP